MFSEKSSSTVASDTHDNGIDFDVVAANCKVTNERRQALDVENFVQRPSIARANLAVATEKPEGSVDFSGEYGDYTVLQQHCLFWDRNMDGAIYPWDTYIGFRELGFNILFSFLAMLVININFSYPTRLAYSYIPDPWFRVYIGSMHKAKHGSDSGTYDKEGRFLPQMFEDMFSKFDSDQDGRLGTKDLLDMIHGHRLAADPFGWFAAYFEFGATWLLVQKNGKVEKEDLRQIYDGSIFFRIREANLRGKGWDKGFGPWDLVRLLAAKSA
ncbi:putative peroxygenase 3 [Diplogelasinospora grovesii]|uniref:Peroxygenase 3 n=1 Tax=Diplogelasinospora grovesii TaxID=303347 RepID=A0AAN6S178_9PEZI|nr:putative peroxygenase 3 [Diplogelasinospora grovesii]